LKNDVNVASKSIKQKNFTVRNTAIFLPGSGLRTLGKKDARKIVTTKFKWDVDYLKGGTVCQGLAHPARGETAAGHTRYQPNTAIEHLKERVKGHLQNK
jgi:hypothetical protein